MIWVLVGIGAIIVLIFAVVLLTTKTRDDP